MATVPFDGALNMQGRSRGVRLGLWWKVAVVAGLLTFGAWWAFGEGKPIADGGAVASAIVERPTTEGLDAVTGAAALENCRKFLADAQNKLDKHSAMTALFHKQERVEGALLPLHVMEMKVRREPFSVYMKWREPDEGQEVIWRHGAHDGKIVVCPAGWKRKVMRMVKIAPDSDQAMAASRRPISSSGIWNFTARLRQTIDQELMRDPNVRVTQTSGAEISGRPCDRYTFERTGSGAEGDFQRMIVYADRGLEVPVALEHYRWHTQDGRLVPQLEESYLFQNLELNADLADIDFDDANPAYEFTKK